MFKKQTISLLLLIIAAGVLTAPAYAQTSTYTISGKIAFPAEKNYDNVTVSDLTIYAQNMSGFKAQANPAADGTFVITVPKNGSYNISVYPAELHLANLTTNKSYLYQYPDDKARFLTVTVTNFTASGVQINGTQVEVVTPTPIIQHPPTATPTAKATPGFTAILLFVGLIGTAAIVINRRK